jgi:hypothetical protein
MFVIIMVFSWCLDLCNNAKQNITMFHHFLNARVPVCRLYQLFFYNFVEILIIYNIRVSMDSDSVTLKYTNWTEKMSPSLVLNRGSRAAPNSFD